MASVEGRALLVWMEKSIIGKYACRMGIVKMSAGAFTGACARRMRLAREGSDSCKSAARVL